MLAQVDHIPDCFIPWVVDGSWWLSGAYYQDASVTVRGVPLPEIVAHLRIVYDAPTSEQMISDGLWGPLAGLFTAQPWLEAFGVMLSLGLDLHTLGEERYQHYVTALRSPDLWMGARLEIGVEAELLRAGMRPERPGLPKDTKQWDFSVEYERVPYAIECKALTAGKLDGNAELLLQRFQNVGALHSQEPRDGWLQLSSWMLRAMAQHSVQRFYECVLPEFTEEFTRTLSIGRPDGVGRPVGRFGLLTVQPNMREDGFLGQWEIGGHEHSLPIHRMRRLMDRLGDATDNFTNATDDVQRVAVVCTGRDYLACGPAAFFVETNVGRTFRAHGTRLAIDRRRLGFHHGVLFGERSNVRAVDRAQFTITGGGVPAQLFQALSSYRFHVRLERGR